jgi:hypothetical protein
MNILDDVLKECMGDMQKDIKEQTKKMVLIKKKEHLIEDMKRAIQERAFIQYNKIGESIEDQYDCLIEKMSIELGEILKELLEKENNT